MVDFVYQVFDDASGLSDGFRVEAIEFLVKSYIDPAIPVAGSLAELLKLQEEGVLPYREFDLRTLGEPC